MLELMTYSSEIIYLYLTGDSIGEDGFWCLKLLLFGDLIRFDGIAEDWLEILRFL